MIEAHAEIDFSIPAMREWWKLPEGGPRAEVVNGNLSVSPSPSTYHAKISLRIVHALMSHFEQNDLGEIFNAPVDVFLNQGSDVIVPDIVFVSNKNRHAVIERRGIYGPPDLIIEILSPGNYSHDLVTKKKLYERSGIREYWIVDPETKNAQGYLLKDGRYGDPLLTNSEIYIRILKKLIQF